MIWGWYEKWRIDHGGSQSRGDPQHLDAGYHGKSPKMDDFNVEYRKIAWLINGNPYRSYGNMGDFYVASTILSDTSGSPER